MTLVEAYCRLNRARGIHVISPHDLMSACLMLKKVPNATLTLREFESKVKVLQHASYDDDIVVGQILSLVRLYNFFKYIVSLHKFIFNCVQFICFSLKNVGHWRLTSILKPLGSHFSLESRV